MKKFTKDHEWVLVEGDTATVGITDHAQAELGDIVFVEMPEVGDEIAQGDDVAVVESVKAAGDVMAAVSGQVTEINDALVDEPALLNSHPETDGWIYKVKLSDASEFDDLMDEAAYQDYLKA